MKADAEFSGIDGVAHLAADVCNAHYRIGFALTREFLHQVRTHIFAVVCNGVIHGESAQRRNKRCVAVAHACESHAVGLCFAEAAHLRHLFARDASVEWLEETHFLQSVAESARFGGKSLILRETRGYDFRHTHIR